MLDWVTLSYPPVSCLFFLFCFFYLYTSYPPSPDSCSVLFTCPTLCIEATVFTSVFVVVCMHMVAFSLHPVLFSWSNVWVSISSFFLFLIFFLTQCWQFLCFDFVCSDFILLNLFAPALLVVFASVMWLHVYSDYHALEHMNVVYVLNDPMLNTVRFQLATVKSLHVIFEVIFTSIITLLTAISQYYYVFIGCVDFINISFHFQTWNMHTSQ